MNTQNILLRGRTKFDAYLDNSELYDYTVGNSARDYIFNEIFVTILTGNFLITEDNCLFETDDNYIIEYQ